MKLNFLSTALASVLLSASVVGAASAEGDYILNTASTGGTYHPVGTAIATLSKVKLLPTENFSLTAVNSAGSGANVQAMAADTAQFAILQGLFGSYAATGTGPVSEPQTNLRSLAPSRVPCKQAQHWQTQKLLLYRPSIVEHLSCKYFARNPVSVICP